MTLITRITRLFSADMHSIIDNLEDPEALLKQAIREMQQAIENSQGQIHNSDKHLERLLSVQKKLTATMVTFAQQLDLAFASDNEVLSKSILAKKLATEHQLDLNATEIEQLSKQQSERQIKLEEKQEKLSAIIEKLALFCDLPSATIYTDFSADLAVLVPSHSVVSKDDIELAYLQEKQRRCQIASVTDQPE